MTLPVPHLAMLAAMQPDRRPRRERISDAQHAITDGNEGARKAFAAFLADRGLLGHGFEDDDIPLGATVDQLIDRYLVSWEGKLALLSWAEEVVDEADAEAALP